MNYSALQTLVETSRDANEPDVVVPRAQQLEHLKELSQALLAAGVRCSPLGQGDRPALRVDPDQQRRAGYSPYQLHVGFSKEGLRELSTGYSGGGVPLTSVAQLVRVLKGADERIAREVALKQRRDKIRGLKRRAIETQIEALAQRMGFAYLLEPMHTKDKLYVRLNPRDTVVIDIPHRTLQEAIERLEPLLRAVRELVQVGLSFQLARTTDVRGFREPGAAQGRFDAGADAEEEEDADE